MDKVKITRVDCYIADSEEHVGISALGFSEVEAKEKLALNIKQFEKNVKLRQAMEKKLSELNEV